MTEIVRLPFQSPRVRSVLFRISITAALVAACTGPAFAFNIYYKNASGGIDMVAASIGSIARRGSTFSKSEFSYKMTSVLCTYPDYPELGYNTPENEAVAEAEAASINKRIAELHQHGVKALAHSYEIEVPKGFIPKHPELECSGAGLRMDGNQATWFIPGEKSGGLCMYKPGAREFIQHRFDELFRRLPDLDGVIFSLNESAVRPYQGCCSVCESKTLKDKVRDMVLLLDDAVSSAMHKVRPDKDPFNVARSWGVPEFVARRDPDKISQLASAFQECPDDIPVVIKVGYGDYDNFMDTAPVAIELARANKQPFLLDIGRRGVEPFAPGIFGRQNQTFFKDTAAAACAGFFYGRSRPESEGGVKIQTLNWDLAVALLHMPSLDLQAFYEQWAAGELGLTGQPARALSRILLNWENVLVLGATVNGCDWPLAGGLAGLSSIDGKVRSGSRWTWNYNWCAKTSGIYHLRAAIFEATTDALGTADEKFARVLAEKQKAVRLARENVVLMKALEGKLEPARYEELSKLLGQAEWWARGREALTRAYWGWWFNPRIDPGKVARAYSQYLAVLEEPVGSPHRDMFYDEREDLEVKVAALGLPLGNGIQTAGSRELRHDGAFEPEPVSDVERGDPMRLWMPRGGTGTATASFTGASGRYEIGVKYRGGAGSGHFDLFVGSARIGGWDVSASGSPSDEWRFYRHPLKSGDDLRVDATGTGESCRLYRIHLRRLADGKSR